MDALHTILTVVIAVLLIWLVIKIFATPIKWARPGIPLWQLRNKPTNCDSKGLLKKLRTVIKEPI